jgi:hypothetical protein
MVLLPVLLLLAACGGGEPTDAPPAEARQVLAETPAPEAGPAARKQRRESDYLPAAEAEKMVGRQRDGFVLAVADPLPPDLARLLPPAFPEDIPLGTWVSVEAVRLFGQDDFVISCTAPYRRDAVGEFFIRTMPGQGWTLANRSDKQILSVYTFKKGDRAVTVMVKKQVGEEDASFDLSYKAG